MGKIRIVVITFVSILLLMIINVNVYAKETDETSEAEYVYSAVFNITYKNCNSLAYETLKRQNYAIIDRDSDEILQEGVTDDDGKINFNYLEYQDNVTNNLNVVIEIYMENHATKLKTKNNETIPGIPIDVEVVFEFKTIVKDVEIEPYLPNILNISLCKENYTLINENTSSADYSVQICIDNIENELYKENINAYYTYVQGMDSDALQERKLNAGQKIMEELTVCQEILKAAETAYIYGERYLPQITCIFDKNINSSAYKPGANVIELKNCTLKTISHEYGHYFSDNYNLCSGGSYPGHSGSIIRKGYFEVYGVIYFVDEHYIIDKAIIEGFAEFFSEVTLCLNNNERISYYEYMGNYRGGEFLEYTFSMLLWDLYDVSTDDDVSISFIDLVNTMVYCESVYDHFYTIYDFCNRLLSLNKITDVQLSELLELNYIVQPFEQITTDSENYINIDAYSTPYYETIDNLNSGITSTFYVVDSYELNFYKKVNNNYILLTPTFDISIDIDKIENINGVTYYNFLIDESIKAFIINNSFKDLYYTIEQTKQITEDKYTVYKSTYKPISYIYELDEEIEVTFINDDNIYSWIALEAPIRCRYKIYSTGSADVMGILYEKQDDENTLIDIDDNATGDDANFYLDVLLDTNQIVYLKVYYVSNTNETVTVHFEMNNTGLLLIDNEKYILHGTEVRLNGGALNGLTITQGLSRIAYIPDSYFPNSRLSYDWYSSNSNVAIVSMYGTIQALSVTEITDVYITAICKTNENLVFYQKVTIVPETDEAIKTIVINIDMEIGETREIVLTDECPSLIVQSYTWNTTSEQICSVGFYTIVKVGDGNAVITGTYKYNNTYQVIINVT